MQHRQRNHIRDPLDIWLRTKYHAHAAEAENQRAQQADAALEVEAEVRVIPPAGVEQLLHDPRGCVFEYRAPTIEIRKMMIGLCTLPRMATPSIAPVP